MKKITLTISTILILTLTACSGASNASPSASGQPNESTASELPTSSRLVVGSFKLEETNFPITQDEAVELLPLWQVYKEISASDTAAQEEVNALIEQIQETLTHDQTNAINKMNLTQRDVFALMQERGVQFGGGQQTGSQNNNDFPGGGFPGGGGGQVFIIQGGPGGGPPSGGQGGQGLSRDQIATAQASRGQNRGGLVLNSTPAPLIQALIQFLKEKAGKEPTPTPSP